jgi:hypothetical protein
MKYEFKQGTRMPIGITAQAVGESLESIKGEYGTLNPENVVKAASDENHVMHPLFEWDDSLAAHQYRINQARSVVRAICVKVVENLPPIRAYVSVTPVVTGVPGQNLRREYQQTHVALSNPDSREQIVSQAKRDLDTYHNKYDALVDLSTIYLDKLIEIGRDKLPVFNFYATFPENSKYFDKYVFIYAFHSKGAVEAMNKIYGKGVWEDIYTEDEFNELLLQLAETKRLLTKLREINTIAIAA